MLCAMSQPMSYAEALRLKLTELMGTVFFSDMRAHLERDAVVVISPELALIEVAIAVANDAASLVEGWIRDGSMRKPSLGERTSWPNDEGRTWLAVVVQPFVLVQDAREIN